MSRFVLLVLIISACMMLVGLTNPVHATDVGGTLYLDTTWSAAGSPYNVVSTITVSAGVELTIEPGAYVGFSGSSGIVVNGVLTAVGVPGNPVTLVGGAAGGNPVDSSSRIFIDDASGATRIEFARISHFNNAVETAVTCTLEHNIIQQNQSVGVLVYANYTTPEPRIVNNLIMHNDLGISLTNSNSVKLFAGTYEYNTIVRNRSAGFKTHDLYGHCEPVTVSHSILAFNGFGLLSEAQEIVSLHNALWRNGTDSHPPDMSSTGEIHDDPMFVNPVSWDFRLSTCSPAETGGADGQQIGVFGNGGGLPESSRAYVTTATTSGTLSRDEQWSGTVTVTDTLRVPLQYVLTIEPGTTVFFEGNAGLDIGGVLFAVGDQDQPITLQGGGNDGPVTESSRLYLNGTPGETTITYASVGFFYDGVYTETSCSGACFITNSVIHDNQRYGLHLVGTYAGAHPFVVNNVVNGNGVGLLLSKTNSAKDIFGDYEYNTIVNNVDQGFYLYDMYGSYTVTVRNSIVASNGLGICSWGGGVSDIVLVSEYNDVWDNTDGNYFSFWGVVGPGAGDISVDPHFADPAAGDFSLLPSSQALTASSEGGEIGAYGQLPPPTGRLVFCDGFELGDTSAWSN